MNGREVMALLNSPSDTFVRQQNLEDSMMARQSTRTILRRIVLVTGVSLTVLAMSAASAAVLSQDDALALAKKSGCLTCHKIEAKLIGPAWKDVAAKYKDDAGARAMLLEKVRKGGRGNWSELTHNMMMPPAPARVSDDDIANLVDFIMSL